MSYRIKELIQEFDEHVAEQRYGDAYDAVQKMRQAVASGVKLMGGF